MTVSAPNTHVYYVGDKERCRTLRPMGFELARRMKQEMRINDYLDIKIAARTTELPNGDSFRILVSHENTWIYILSPDVVGRYEVIEETKLVYDLYMDPILYFDSDKEIRLIETDEDFYKCRNADEFSENQCYSQRLFERVEIARNKDSGAVEFTPRDFTSYSESGVLTYDTKVFSKNLALNKVCYPANKTRSHGLHHCYSSWSKSLDGYTAHAILYYNSYVGMNMWCIAVDAAGKAYSFQAAKTSPISYHWPVSGYLDKVWCSNSDPYNTTQTYKCFDLWKEDVTGDNGEVTEHYFVSCIGDPDDYIQVWDLTTGEYSYIGLHTAYDYAPEGYPGGKDGWRSRHIRHIGLVKRTLYWAQQDHYYGVPAGASGTIHWENDTQYGEINLGSTECGIQFAILNEFTQEIEWMDDIACQQCDWGDYSTNGPTWDYGKRLDIRNGVAVACYPPSGIPGRHCTISTTCGGEQHSYTIWGDSGILPTGDTEHEWNWSYWHWDCSTSEYICDQTGLQPGEFVTSTRYRYCWGIEQGDSDTSDMYCGFFNLIAASGYPPSLCDAQPEDQHCGGCAVAEYENYRVYDGVLSANVIPTGLGVKYDITVLDGEEGMNCEESDDYNNVVSSEHIYTIGVFDENYAQSHWPFYPQFAIMVSGETCSVPILTEKKKYRRRNDSFIDGIRIKLTEDFIEDNCRFRIGGDKYSIIKDNDDLLHDNLGNTFHRNFETEDVGLFFLLQRKVKTRRINDYAD